LASKRVGSLPSLLKQGKTGRSLGAAHDEEIKEVVNKGARREKESNLEGEDTGSATQGTEMFLPLQLSIWKASDEVSSTRLYAGVLRTLQQVLCTELNDLVIVHDEEDDQSRKNECLLYESSESSNKHESLDGGFKVFNLTNGILIDDANSESAKNQKMGETTLNGEPQVSLQERSASVQNILSPEEELSWTVWTITYKVLGVGLNYWEQAMSDSGSSSVEAALEVLRNVVQLAIDVSIMEGSFDEILRVNVRQNVRSSPVGKEEEAYKNISRDDEVEESVFNDELKIAGYVILGFVATTFLLLQLVNWRRRKYHARLRKRAVEKNELTSRYGDDDSNVAHLRTEDYDMEKAIGLSAPLPMQRNTTAMVSSDTSSSDDDIYHDKKMDCIPLPIALQPDNEESDKSSKQECEEGQSEKAERPRTPIPILPDGHEKESAFPPMESKESSNAFSVGDRSNIGEKSVAAEGAGAAAPAVAVTSAIAVEENNPPNTQINEEISQSPVTSATSELYLVEEQKKHSTALDQTSPEPIETSQEEEGEPAMLADEVDGAGRTSEQISVLKWEESIDEPPVESKEDCSSSSTEGEQETPPKAGELVEQPISDDQWKFTEAVRIDEEVKDEAEKARTRAEPTTKSNKREPVDLDRSIADTESDDDHSSRRHDVAEIVDIVMSDLGDVVRPEKRKTTVVKLGELYSSRALRAGDSDNEEGSTSSSDTFHEEIDVTQEEDSYGQDCYSLPDGICDSITPIHNSDSNDGDIDTDIPDDSGSVNDDEESDDNGDVKLDLPRSVYLRPRNEEAEPVDSALESSDDDDSHKSQWSFNSTLRSVASF